MKVVLDSNVLLAAFGTRGLCESVLVACLESHEIALSDHILCELRDHLSAKFMVPDRQVKEVLKFLRENVLLVQPADIPKRACRDAADLPVLGTAVAAEAQCLVTGDKDLLALGQYHGISILDPRSLYDRLRSDRP